LPPILSVWLCGRLLHPDVICEYVYWDKEAKEKAFYQPGDFERLFSEPKKIKLLYKDSANILEIATLPPSSKTLKGSIWAANSDFNLSKKHPAGRLQRLSSKNRKT
jgi:hypothetical protein